MDAVHSHARSWTARWIWDRAPASEMNSYKLFRKEIVIAEREPGTSLGAISLHITADTRYQVFVDGVKVGHGPPLGIGFWYYYDTYDLTALLTPGRHCLAVVVNHQGISPASRGGLLCELTDAAGTVWGCTDETWSVTNARAWESDTFRFQMSYYVAFQERYDSRAEPDGWKLPGYDDGRWERARILTGLRSDRPPAVAPWTVLLPRDIPHMRETGRHAVAVAGIEEALDLTNRTRPDDLSIALSMPGQPLQHASLTGAEHLLADSGDAAAVAQCSTGHLSGALDGVYNPCLLLDFGRSINAFPEIALDGPSGGVVDIGYAERLINGHFNNALEGQFADRYVMKDGYQVYRPMTWKSFRYLKLVFRSLFAPVRVVSVKAIETVYPFEDAGRFNSGDAVLNQVFDICRHTIRLCSNECIMDTPWREQAQFTGDTASVIAGGIYSCFGEDKLIAKFLRQSAAVQLPNGWLANVTHSLSVDSNADWTRVIPDYSLWWIYGLWRHYEFTGDAGWIHRYYPHAIKIMQAFAHYLGPSGLLEHVPGNVLIDWADIDRRGINAPLNAMFFGIGELVERMAVMKKDAYAAAWIRRIRAGMKRSFDAHLYDSGRGCYADANIDGKLSEKRSEHGNMAAIYWGIGDGRRAWQVLRNWLQDKESYTECQPFYTSVTLKALAKYDCHAEALALIRERWGKRMLNRGATSTWEEWNSNGSWRHGDVFTPLMRSQSHAWSAYPAEFLIRELAGFRILEPGGAKIALRPAELPFDAEISIPVGHGVIEVQWSRGRVDIRAPETVEIVREGPNKRRLR